jgi:cystathionine gamma-synthase
MTNDQLGAGTQAVWAGEYRARGGDFTQVPVVHSVSYGYDDVDHWTGVAVGDADGHIYGRNTNPTVAVFEEKIRIMEGGEAATSMATGMAAISNTLFALLAPGKRVVSVKDTYGGTNRIFSEFLPHYGVEVEVCDTSDHDQIEAEVTRGCDLLYLETPTNPTLKVLDLERLSTAGKAAGATVMVDNTVATPINQNPLALGADLVVHSATKYLGGHADALGGVVVGSGGVGGEGVRLPRDQRRHPPPMAAYLLLRGMKTLHLRIERQNANAMAGGPPPVRASHGHGGQLSRPRVPSPARDRRPSDARLRGDAQLRAQGDFEAVRKFIPAMERATPPPTWGRWRRSSPRPPPPATSSARPRSGRRWAFPRA